MLVLSRRLNQSFTLIVPGLSEPILAVVADRQAGNEIKIGIEAPREVRILQTELLEAGRKEARQG